MKILIKFLFLFGFLMLSNQVLKAQGTGLGKCYADRDQDGFGDPNDFLITDASIGCGGLTGNIYKADNGFDCDDTKADINPQTKWYIDPDRDGWPVGYQFIVQCQRPGPDYFTQKELASLLGGTWAIGPEFCDIHFSDLDISRVIDCDQNTTNNLIGRFGFWLPDNDQDGAPVTLANYYFSCDTPRVFLQPERWVNVGDRLFCKPEAIIIDCNDNDPLQKPGQGWYLDGDNDGFPLNNTPEFVQCLKPAGPYKPLVQLTSLAEDCNDLNASVFPGTWYEDKDGDGLITGKYVFACNKPDGYIFLPDGGGLIDCDDTDPRATISQGWFPDVDGDKHGGAGVIACKGPAGWFTRFELISTNDCNDNNNKIFPGAIELCNGIDDDCDGLIDESFCCPTTSIIYVAANATGANNGSSWANAYTKLQNALETARRCGSQLQIWVAGGIYYPDEGILPAPNNKDESFKLPDNVTIYGGFAGTETTNGQRNLAAENHSILSGEIQQDGNQLNNSNNVVWAENLSSAVLDGFIIRDGYSNTILPELQSKGTGLLVLNGTSPVFRNLVIQNNEGLYGAAITNIGNTPFFVNCVITGNRTSAANGAVWNDNASPAYYYCSIANNSIIGGNDFVVMRNSATSSPNIRNTIIRGVSPAVAGGSPSINYSIIQNPSVWPGTGNSNADPLFINEGTGNLRLKPCSPAINTGGPLIFGSTDIVGTARPFGGTNDMGAYEFSSLPILYVNAAAATGGDGSSWAAALRSLQDALRVQYCPAIREIWVAKGTYTPTTNTNRDSAFTMRNNLAIYGGFAGTETLLSQRNWRINPTILSGDIGTPSNNSDNSYNVIRNDNNGLNATAILDGFTITGGNANKGTYIGNRGGAINNYATSPSFYNCIITGNNAVEYGGGIFNEASVCKVVNGVFAGNTALYGGGLYNESAATELINCTFAGNQAVNTGGAIYTYGTVSPKVTNTIVWGNSSGIQNAGGATPVVGFSIVQASSSYLPQDSIFILKPAPGLGNMGDLRLRACSPAINTGSNAALVGETLDIANNPRISQNNIDMGAYERQTSPIATVYVDSAAKGNNDGSSWLNSYNSLTDAINDLNKCSDFSAPTTINIAKGTYTLPVNENTTLNRSDAIVLGGYPNGGGTRNPGLNPVLIIGNVQVAKSLQLDGVRIRK